MTTSAPTDSLSDPVRDPLKERTVLYVDDDRIVQAMTCKLLEKRFARVMTANDGKTALALFRQHRPDIVITDIRMPEMNGLELAAQIKAESPTTPIIVTSIFNLQDYFLRAIDIGIDHYLLKPIDAAKIFRALERVVHSLQVEEERQMYAQAFADAGSALSIHDMGHRVIAVNQAFCRLVGFPREELLGATPRLWRSGYHPESFYDEMHATLARTGVWQGEVKNRRKDGQIFIAHLALSTVYDPAGRPLHYVSVISDITERAQHEADLDRLAHHDPLTGLPNRLLLADRIEQGMAQAVRNGRKMALLYVDLDEFKPVNDQHGHLTGDHLLRAVGDQLSQVVRHVDTVARIGGDEFVVLLPNIQVAEDAGQIAAKIVHALGQAFTIDDLTLKIGASLGIALYPDDGQDAATLLQRADAALYRAKAEGRSTWRFARVAGN